MKQTFYYTSLRCLGAGLFIVAFTASGCAGWATNQLGPESMRQRFDSLRDTRAVEMDERLSKSPVPVNNPFSPGEPREEE